MKTILIVTAIIAYSLARPQENDVYSNHAIIPLVTCREIYGLNDTMMAEATEDITPEDNIILVNFFKCFWEQLKFVDENGVFDYERINELLVLFVRDNRPQIHTPSKLADQTMEHCKNIPKTDNTALEVVRYKNCLMKFLRDTINNIDSHDHNFV